MAQPQQAQNVSRQLLARRDVEARTSLSRTSIYRLAKAGQFPKPVQITQNRVGWRADDIEAWIETRTVKG